MTKKLLLTLLLIGVSLCGYSQTTAKKQKQKDTVPYDERYNKLKELHIKNLDSKSQIAADSLFQVFVYKITPDVDFNVITEENQDLLVWAKTNIAKTEFKDAAEAEKLWAEYEQEINVSTAENKEYYEYLLDVFQTEGGIDLHLKVMEDVDEQYPEKNRRIKLPARKKKSAFYPKLPGQ